MAQGFRRTLNLPFRKPFVNAPRNGQAMARRGPRRMKRQTVESCNKLSDASAVSKCPEAKAAVVAGTPLTLSYMLVSGPSKCSQVSTPPCQASAL